MAVCSLWPCGIVEANPLPALRSQRGDPRKHGGPDRTRLCAWAVIATGPVVMVTLAAGKALWEGEGPGNQPGERKKVRWQEAKGGRKAEWRGSTLLVGRRGFNVGGHRCRGQAKGQGRDGETEAEEGRPEKRQDETGSQRRLRREGSRARRWGRSQPGAWSNLQSLPGVFHLYLLFDRLCYTLNTSNQMPASHV